MTLESTSLWRALLLVMPLLLLSASLPAFGQPGGILVEDTPGMSSQATSLQPGDVLLSWRRDAGLTSSSLPTSGKLILPFDLVEVFLEQVPRGPVVVEGRRGTGEMVWVLPSGAPLDLRWLRTAPLLSGEALALYRQARVPTASDMDSILPLFRSAANSASAQGDAGAAVWLLFEGARVAGLKNRWPEADTFYTDALSLREASGGNSYVSAQILREWGVLLQERAIWDHAEDCFRRALTLDRQKPFESLSSAMSLIGLGYTDNLSGGPKDDGAYFRQAIEIRHRLAPGSLSDALGWLHRGRAAALDEQWPAAVERYEKGVDLLESLGNAQLSLADVLFPLASAWLEQGEREVAGKLLRRAYALLREEAPHDLLMSRVTRSLGLVEAEEGNLVYAEELLSTSLQISHEHDPGGFYEADASRRLGHIQVRAGKRESGSRNLCHAVDLIETWRLRFQDNEEKRGRWGYFFAPYYQDCAESMIEIGREEDAFLVLERGRARAFLDLGAERSIRQAALPAGLKQEWNDLDAEYDRAQEVLERARSRKVHLEQIANLEGSLREIRRKKERILDRVLPPGAVRYPEPISLAESRARLDPGTALLYYSVGESKSFLYVLLSGTEAPGWAVLPLQVRSAELKRRVESFRKALVTQRASQQDLQTQGQALYDILVRPAEPYLNNSNQVVISPDGPLHVLPFGALLRDRQYLIEWKPVHYTLSATVYADLLKRRKPARAPWKLLAFGDPAYPRSVLGRAKPSETLLRMGLREGVDQLPATRTEVEGIANLFAGSRAILGAEVTEATVKRTVRDASLIHFAVHGFLDERTPLNSGLILTPPKGSGVDRNNGVLQAWEVMDEMPIDADLVTLSACDTALGREVGGEGLIGLTRAFQYAGARSVIGTLWGISDRSTAGFMVQLYKALRAGKSKDEALREAQIAQIHSSKPQPFYWAAFELFGDWQ